MKFLKSEYDSLKSEIESAGCDYSDFSFVKKRGTLNVSQKGKEESFAFFRKKETLLNDQMQFVDTVTYFIGAKKDLSVDSWDEVLKHFRDFLAR